MDSYASEYDQVNYGGIFNENNTNIEYIPSLPENVVIGFTKDYSFTVTRRNFGIWYLVGLIFLALFFILVIVAMLWVAYNTGSKSDPYVPPPSSVLTIPEFEATDEIINNSNIGGSNMKGQQFKYDEQQCKTINNTIWTGKCECKHNFYGENCDLSKHDKSYFSVGDISLNKINTKKLKTIENVDKSFSEGSCSKLCDFEQDCNGFHYKNRTCTLLQKVNIPKRENIAFDVNKNSTLFFKNELLHHSIKFDDMILLAKNKYDVPKRYWINPTNSKKNTYVCIQSGQITKISFLPTYSIINNSNLYGIYSKFKFELADIKNIIDKGMVYIHNPESELIFPFTWNDAKIIYVVYVEL